MPNTNNQTIHQFGAGISQMVRQATGQDNIESIGMDWVTVEQTAKPHEKSGDIVGFYTTLVSPMKVITDIVPVQDLNGQEYPWPAGGGINQFDPDNVSEYTISSDTRNGHEYTIPGTYAVHAYGNGDSCYIMARVKNSDDTWEATNYIVDGTTATLGAVFTIAEGQKLYVYDGSEHTSTVSEGLFNSWKIQVALSSTIPNAYHPYSNICPISGYTGVDITRTGKNLWDEDSVNWKNNYLLGPDGVESSNNNYKYTQAYLTVKQGTTYTIQMVKSTATTVSLTVCEYDTYKNFLQRDTVISSDSSSGLVYGSFTTGSNTKFIRVSLRKQTLTNFQLAEETSPSEYEEYQGEVYQISFPVFLAGTVYGGTLTVNEDGSRTLIVDTGYTVWDGSTNVTKGSGTKNYYLPIIDGSIAGRTSSGWMTQDELNEIHLMCNLAKVEASFDDTVVHAAAYCGSSLILQPRIFLPDCETAEEATAWLQEQNTAGHPLTWCYMLKEPIEIDLTDSDTIVSLKGANYVWADTGPLSVKYITEEEF